MEKQMLNPSHWKRPPGYSHLVRVSGGTHLFLSGQVAEDEAGNLVGKDDICKQFDQALSNIDTVLGTADASLSNIVKMTIYCRDREQYRSNAKEIGAIYLRHFGKYFPAMTFVEVQSLIYPDYLLEIDVCAVV